MTSAITTPFFTSRGKFNCSITRSFTLDKFTIEIPRAGRVIFPSVSSCLIIETTSLLGIANPIPSTEDFEIFIELIPMTWPALLINAPPEFPGLIAASV